MTFMLIPSLSTDAKQITQHIHPRQWMCCFHFGDCLASDFFLKSTWYSRSVISVTFSKDSALSSAALRWMRSLFKSACRVAKSCGKSSSVVCTSFDDFIPDGKGTSIRLIPEAMPSDALQRLIVIVPKLYFFLISEILLRPDSTSLSTCDLNDSLYLLHFLF